jgi:hypothetical protein
MQEYGISSIFPSGFLKEISKTYHVISSPLKGVVDRISKTCIAP